MFVCICHPFTNCVYSPSLSPALSLSLCLSQEYGQMEQTAQTSTPCAGHMTDPCWPLPMTLAKCTCSPSPPLNQGSVRFTHYECVSVHTLFLYWHTNNPKLSNSSSLWFFSLLHTDIDLLHLQSWTATLFFWLGVNAHVWKLSRNK